jgi:hypothetical protein
MEITKEDIERGEKALSLIRGMISDRTTGELVSIYKDTEKIIRKKRRSEVAIIRGCIMDALEARHPEQFNAWLDGLATVDLAEYFKGL